MVYDDDVPRARRRVSVDAVRQRAEQAITRRLGNPTPTAIIAVEAELDRNAVLLHLNSGGNSLCCEEALIREGYVIEDLGTHWSGFGVVLRIGPVADQPDTSTHRTVPPETSGGRTALDATPRGVPK